MAVTRVLATFGLVLVIATPMPSPTDSCDWNVMEMPRVAAAALQPQDLFTKYQDTPVVITGLDRVAPPLSFETVASMCADSSIPTYRFDPGAGSGWAGINSLKPGLSREEVSLPDFIAQLQQEEQAATAANIHPTDLLDGRYGFDYTLAKDCPEMLKEFKTPRFASEDILQEFLHPNPDGNFGWPTMLMGPRGTRTELHSDHAGLPFWMSLHRGRKLFRVLPYLANIHLTEPATAEEEIWPGAAGDTAFRSRVLEQLLHDEKYEFESFRPDFEAFPVLCEAVVYETTLEAGEVLWMPNAAAHGALNLEASIAVTANFFSPFDARQATWFEAECERQRFNEVDCELVTARIESRNKAHPKGVGAVQKDLSYWEVKGAPSYDSWLYADTHGHTQYSSKTPSQLHSLALLRQTALAAVDAANLKCAATGGDDLAPAARVLKWVEGTSIPPFLEGGPQWDLADLKTYWMDSIHVHEDMYAHSRPPPLFTSISEQKEVLQVIGRLLHEGLYRLLSAAASLLGSLVDAVDVEIVLASTRATVDSFEDFWRQASAAIRLGRRQLLNVPDWAEYGPETNFWLKFRPYLQCRRSPRLGREIGGSKAWCNPEYFAVEQPRFVFSAGSGGDFTYEDFIRAKFPEAKTFVADCFVDPVTSQLGADRPLETMEFLPKCMHGLHSDDTYMLADEERESFVSFPELIEDLRTQEKDFDNFNIIKANIEAFEYQSFSALMRDPEEYLRGTWQINIEMHRAGMADHGLEWSSMLFSELLFATFMSAGFHPTSTEKWHDSTGAQDIAFVNSTWFMQSELWLTRHAWRLRDSDPVVHAFVANLRTEPEEDFQDLDRGQLQLDHPEEECPDFEVLNPHPFDINVRWVSVAGLNEDAFQVPAGATKIFTTFTGHFFVWSGVDDDGDDIKYSGAFAVADCNVGQPLRLDEHATAFASERSALVDKYVDLFLK